MKGQFKKGFTHKVNGVIVHTQVMKLDSTRKIVITKVIDNKGGK